MGLLMWDLHSVEGPSVTSECGTHANTELYSASPIFGSWHTVGESEHQRDRVIFSTDSNTYNSGAYMNTDMVLPASESTAAQGNGQNHSDNINNDMNTNNANAYEETVLVDREEEIARIALLQRYRRARDIANSNSNTRTSSSQLPMSSVIAEERADNGAWSRSVGRTLRQNLLQAVRDANRNVGVGGSAHGSESPSRTLRLRVDENGSANGGVVDWRNGNSEDEMESRGSGRRRFRNFANSSSSVSAVAGMGSASAGENGSSSVSAVAGMASASAGENGSSSVSAVAGMASASAGENGSSSVSAVAGIASASAGENVSDNGTIDYYDNDRESAWSHDDINLGEWNIVVDDLNRIPHPNPYTTTDNTTQVNRHSGVHSTPSYTVAIPRRVQYTTNVSTHMNSQSLYVGGEDSSTSEASDNDLPRVPLFIDRRDSFTDGYPIDRPGEFLEIVYAMWASRQISDEGVNSVNVPRTDHVSLSPFTHSLYPYPTLTGSGDQNTNLF
eukprot:CFRG5644T1